MKVLYCEWNAFANNFIKKAFNKAGIDTVLYNFDTKGDVKKDESKVTALVKTLFDAKPEFVFSINYFPVIAIACKACRVKYVSWTYDSPYILLYSDTIKFDTNYAFIFEKGEYNKLKALGINTVYYLPMAADVDYLSKFKAVDIYKADVAMVGSLYCEKKHRMMGHFSDVSDYCKGFLDAAVQAQKFLYGISVTEGLLTDKVISELSSAAPMLNPDDELQTPSWTYAKYFLDREVTRLERKELLDLISAKYDTKIYTYEKTPFIPNLKNMGYVEYYNNSPYVFKSTKINLNITLRSIETGMPLRAFDIMGNGAFLLTNYQSDFLDFFVAGEDFAYFESPEDAMGKIEYYLSHEKERNSIAQNGFAKVAAAHTYDIRVKQIIDTVF